MGACDARTQGASIPEGIDATEDAARAQHDPTAQGFILIRVPSRAALAAFVAAFTLGGVTLAEAARADAAGQLSVSVDSTSISTKLGRRFSFQTTLVNRGSAPASGLIAHLNVLSLRDGVYVDPEDWSSHRTRYLPTVSAGGSKTITWKLEAVNAGSFGVYVAVLPQSGPPSPPTTGPTIRVAVAERRTLDSGGILPLALGIPAALGLAWIAVRLGRSRSRTSRFGKRAGTFRE